MIDDRYLGPAGVALSGESPGFAVSAVLMEGVAKGPGALKAVFRVAGHGLFADGGELRRNGLIEGGFGAVVGVHHHREEGLSRIGRRSGEGFKEDRSQKKDIGVGAQVFAVALDHLGSHIGGGAGRLGDLFCQGQAAGGVIIDGNGDAPVQDVDLAEFTEHDVFGLEIAVNDSLAMGKLNGVADLGEDFDVQRQGVFGAEGLGGGFGILDDVQPGGPGDLLHDDHRRPVVISAQGVDGHDIGVLQKTGGPALSKEHEGGAQRRGVAADLF